jgi:hypothetical protein
MCISAASSTIKKTLKEERKKNTPRNPLYSQFSSRFGNK